MVITGPNGGGKTTLAKAIMGLVPATAGSILWNGEELAEHVHCRAGQTGRLLRLPAAAPVQGHAGLGPSDALPQAKSSATTRPAPYLTKVGLCARDYVDRDVDASLSGGEVKRIEIATILARNCQLMIFDEPEAGIDLWSFARLTETFSADPRRQQDAPSSSSPTRSGSSAWPTRSCWWPAGELQERGPVDEHLPQNPGPTPLTGL